MNDFFELFTSADFYSMILQLATPLVFASLAALVSNKVGVLNIGIEGSMVISALAAAIFSTLTNSSFIGVIAGVMVGILMGLFFATCVVKLRTNHILVGIATNILAAGLAIFVVYAITGNKSDYPGIAMTLWTIPILDKIPFLGEILFTNINPLIYLAIIGVFAIRFLLNRTVLGLRIIAVGKNEVATASVGVKTSRVKMIALLIAGGLAGLGGAYLSLGYMSNFNTGMVAGRGFIGIAAEAIGAGNPIATALFAVLFGAVNAFSLAAQTFSTLAIPYELLNTLPYLTTAVGLVIYSIIRYHKTHPHSSKRREKHEKSLGN
ncbi:MAG: ABC transporter permease [Candidatus Izemoplasmatales bacterium]|jgi:simple sugar transport system permease protein|nr:ABC transporter permease [Candidatus Izemoplasmatales bacterium]MDD4596118.1 ABC transporter permease [Candidatus Izemoplasmatales bacterium]